MPRSSCTGRWTRSCRPRAQRHALVRLAQSTPPPAIGNRRFKIYYATQTGNRPFRIQIFCNREEPLTENYRRYLEAGLGEGI